MENIRNLFKLNKKRNTYTQASQDIRKNFSMNSTFFVGDYEITYLCLQTFPCQHDIRKNNDDWKRLNAEQIYYILKEEGLKCEHFDEMEEIIKFYTSPEYLARRKEEEERQQRQKIESNREKLRNENDIKIITANDLGKKCQASSRLDKLHIKHNIK
jgi:hypothetical protein